MSEPPASGGPNLHELLALFPTSGPPLFQAEVVPGDAVPPPYHGLLVHEYHMTVTVEAYHGDLVSVRVLAKQQQGETYAREILLALRTTGRIVQFGIVRIHLQYCSPAVRAEILEGTTPLGRILIKHEVLRRIEPTAFLRVVPGPDMMTMFGLPEPRPTYGRLAYIHCDEQPAVELLEIVAPE
jgi:chorismate-pyruvate lyase